MPRPLPALLIGLLLLLPQQPGLAAAQSAAPAKDQSQLGIGDAPDGAGDAQGEEASPALPDDEAGGSTEGEPADIPDVQIIELTPDIARRALDAYAVVNEAYKNDNLEDYESLDDFIAKAPRGPNLKSDITSHGFATVDDWNAAITTIGLVYGALTKPQADDVQSQIDDIDKDTSLDPAMKERMVASLKAMIPSPGNRQIVEDMMKDEGYAAKLKLLDQEE